MKYNYPFKRIEFWKDPTKSGAPDKRIRSCRPEWYLNMENVSELVVSTVGKYALKKDTILEIGCGTGRNLVALKKAGYKKVSGIEISEKTVGIGRDHFPMYKNIPVEIGPAEQLIDDVPETDVIYTVGLLMHIPPEHEGLFAKIAERARKVIMVIEGESLRATSEHAWNREYRSIFEAFGWREVEMETCEKYPPLPQTTVKRVFIRPEPEVIPVEEVIETEEMIPLDIEVRDVVEEGIEVLE